MSATAAVANQSTPSNKQQKQTAKEVIAANIQALIEQLEQGHSEALTAYLTAMGKFQLRDRCPIKPLRPSINVLDVISRLPGAPE